MSSVGPSMREVYVAGVGLHPFGRFPEVSTLTLSQIAVREALQDASIPFSKIEAAYYGHVYYQGTTPAQAILRHFGLTGIPILNVENACASGASAFWQAYLMIALGVYDVVLAFGSERVPRGPVSVSETAERAKYMGTDHMMARYALRMRRYMDRYGAPPEVFAQIAVRAKANAMHNANAQFQKPVTLDEVLASPRIAEPLTLFQCCPTTDGASAAVLMAGDVVARHGVGGRAIRVRGASLRTTPYQGPEENEPEGTALAARDVYEMSGVGPQEVDIAQVHDAATIGEIEHLEFAGLFPRGEAWVATRDGRTAIGGDLPVNSDGGLQAMGHPFGASGIRMVHELVTQLRGEAGPRAVADARVGLAQCTGSGGVNTVILLSTT